MSSETLLGKDITRLDAFDKVTGRYVYGMDHRIPGALESVVLHSPLPHARIININIKKAEALEGVRAIILGRDLAGIYMTGPVEDQPPLAVDVVRFWGEPIALIAADSLDIAKEASRLIEIEYDPLPVVRTPEEALQPDKPLIHPNWASYPTVEDLNRSGNICCHAQLAKGDVEIGFAEADYIIEDIFSTESVHQSHVEPRAATGLIEPGGRIGVYSNTQLPFHIRASVAHVLGVKEEDVNIHPTGIGGAFGSKLYPQIEPFVALLARKTGRPVHMVATLEEELANSLPRHPIKTHLKSGVKKDGTLVALQAKSYIDSGAYAGSGPEVAGIQALLLPGLYRYPNIKIDAFTIYTNKMNFGAYRGPGGPQAVFAIESHMDHIAEKVGMDPLDFRFKNLLNEGDDAPNGQILTAMGLRETMEKATSAIEWNKPTGPYCGKGMAIGWWTTTLQKSTCMVDLDEEGRVVVSVGTQDIGTGALYGGVAQMVAETMNQSLDKILIQVMETQKELWDWGSQGSRSLFNIGRAAHFACKDLTDKLLNMASHLLEIDMAELELRDGAIVSKANPSERVSLADLKKMDTRNEFASLYESVPEPFKFDKSRVKGCLYPVFNYPHYYCHAAEVKVDPDTGETTILRFAAAHDIGFAVNPTLIRGQIHGGVGQGIGMAFMEDVKYKDGYRENINWTDYKIPTMCDVPDVDAIIVEHKASGESPYGVKGLGEAPVIPPPSALANAVAKAIGVRIHSLPMTSEKVLKAIQSKVD